MNESTHGLQESKVKIKIYRVGRGVSFGGLTKNMNRIFFVSESSKVANKVTFLFKCE